MTNDRNNALLCPGCRKLISRDEPTCPHCGLARPGSRLKANWWTQGLQSPELLIKAIIYANVGFYKELAAAGITSGCNPPVNDRYCPNHHLTRGQMAAMLVRALGLTATDGTDFTDDDNSIFESSIERLAAAGITYGCNPPNNTKFCPTSRLTRGQMAAFLVRALDL